MKPVLNILKWGGIGLLSLALLLAATVYGISEYRLTRTYDVPLAAIDVPHDAISVAEGKRLVGVYHCGACHGEGYVGKEFINAPNVARIIAANLTTSIPTYSDPELARLVRHAVKKDGQNAWMFASGMYTPMTDADLGKIIGYLRTIPPAPNPGLGTNSFGPVGRGLIVAGEFPIMAAVINHQRIPAWGQDTTQLGRGRYLTMTVCSGCHGGPTLAGRTDDHMKSPALVIATSYTNAQFRHLLHTGEGNRKKDCGMMSALAKGFLHNLTNRETDAIYTYLQTLPDQAVASR